MPPDEQQKEVGREEDGDSKRWKKKNYVWQWKRGKEGEKPENEGEKKENDRGEMRKAMGAWEGEEETLGQLLNWLNRIKLLTWINSAWLEHNNSHDKLPPEITMRSFIHI